MITVSQGFRSKTFPNSLLPNICLQISGGGWTAKQTANALILKPQIEATGRAVLHRASGNITITLDEEES